MTPAHMQVTAGQDHGRDHEHEGTQQDEEQPDFTYMFAVAAVGIALSVAAGVQREYDTGATDTELPIGQTVPCSRPTSAYAVSARPRPPISG